MSDSVEADVARWFRDLPAGHPAVEVLRAAAIARKHAAATNRPTPLPKDRP